MAKSVNQVKKPVSQCQVFTVSDTVLFLKLKNNCMLYLKTYMEELAEKQISFSI